CWCEILNGVRGQHAGSGREVRSPCPYALDPDDIPDGAKGASPTNHVKHLTTQFAIRFVLPSKQEHTGMLAPTLRLIRIQLGGPMIVGRGHFPLAEFGVDAAALVMRFGPVRGKLDGLAEGGEGVAPGTFSCKGGSESEVRVGELRLKFNGLAMGSDGMI